MKTYVILRRGGWRTGADLEAADLPVDEIIEVADTVVVRADPEPAAV